MFMRLMNDVLRPFIDSFVIVYLDDILVYNVTWEEHISHLTQMLETLKKHHLLANLKKCEFARQPLVYLGYVIGGGELKIDPANMEAIMKWLVPTNVFGVKSFIGAAQYLRKFIASISAISAPLHAITKRPPPPPVPSPEAHPVRMRLGSFPGSALPPDFAASYNFLKRGSEARFVRHFRRTKRGPSEGEAYASRTVLYNSVRFPWVHLGLG
eukprot:PITA_27358